VNESAPIQLAQCWFPGLAISSAKLQIYFSNKTYGNNFVKQHSETVISKMLIAVQKIKFIVPFSIFCTLSFPVIAFYIRNQTLVVVDPTVTDATSSARYRTTNHNTLVNHSE